MADLGWQTETLPVPGAKGLDLRSAVDKVDPLGAVVLSNVRLDQDGALRSRAGQTLLATAGSRIHTIRRLEVPASQSAALQTRTFRIDEFDQQGATSLQFQDLAAFALLEFTLPGAGSGSPDQYLSTRFWGVGSDVYTGLEGALTLRDSGYSGAPLCFLPYRPPLSAVAWMHVADTLKMRRMRPDGLVVQLGLPAPKGRVIAQRLPGGGLAYLTAPVPGTSISGSVTFEWTTPGDASKFFLSVGTTRNGAVSGPPDATNLYWQEFPSPTSSATVPGLPSTDLYVALWTFYPVSGWNVQPLVYFYNGAPGTNPTPLPGTRTIDTFSTPSDWSYGGGTGSTGTTAASAARPGSPEGTGNTATVFTLDPGSATGSYHSWFYRAHASGLDLSGDDEDPLRLWVRPVDPSVLSEINIWVVVSPDFDGTNLPGTSSSLNTESYKITLPGDAFNPGQSAWNEWGGLDLPLKRKDAERYGTSSNLDWSTVSGIIIDFVATDPSALVVACDDWTTGSLSRLDSTPVGAAPYDWRYTNYDPRTGDEGNPSDEWYPAQRLKVAHEAILLKPQPYGDSAVRQRFYRRGGSLVEDWYFIGDNEEDGGWFLDVFGDDEIQTSRLLEIDNYQPIPTTGPDGETIEAQPIPVLVGPVQGIVLGLGDPLRPGDLVWCKPGNTGSWPPGNRTEVCDSSEELMNGAIWGGQAYLYSRERMYAAYPNLTGSAALVTTTPTANPKGLVARWGLCVGPDGMYQVARDGIYRTTGAEPTALTDGALWPIFHGEASQTGEYLPIDFSAEGAAAIRLECFNNEIWFLYRATDGTHQVLVWSIIFQRWFHHRFYNPPACLYSEESVTEQRLLMGGHLVGKAWTLGGDTDDGAPIPSRYRSGALDQGAPRALKLYGDLFADLDRQGADFTVTVRMDNDLNLVASGVIASNEVSDDAAYPPTTAHGGRRRYTLDLTAPPTKLGGEVAALAPRKGRNISMEFSWERNGPAPAMFACGASFDIQPETTVGRVTVWDYLGAVVDKRVKGLILECDTFGANKTLWAEADNETKQTFTVSTTGRQIVQVSFPQFVGRLLRLRAEQAHPWLLYQFQWIFDEEPLRLARWETQEVNHGIVGWQKPLFSYITLLSDADVTLTMTTFLQGGQAVVKTYTLPATGGTKVQLFVPFEATRGVLFKYLFTSKTPFHLYREESQVTIEPWGAKETVVVRPFGSDDLDLVRHVFNAEGLAGRTGFPYPDATQATLQGSANNPPSGSGG